MAFDRQIAALTTYCEASSARSDERACVTHTYFNRVKSGRYPKTVAGVCLQRMQYSEWNADAADNRNLLRGATVPDNDPIMLDCLAVFDAVAAGSPDPTKGATHYTDKTIAPPPWTVGAIMTLETPKFRFYSGVK